MAPSKCQENGPIPFSRMPCNFNHHARQFRTNLKTSKQARKKERKTCRSASRCDFAEKRSGTAPKRIAQKGRGTRVSGPGGSSAAPPWRPPSGRQICTHNPVLQDPVVGGQFARSKNGQPKVDLFRSESAGWTHFELTKPCIDQTCLVRE